MSNLVSIESSAGAAVANYPVHVQPAAELSFTKTSKTDNSGDVLTIGTVLAKQDATAQAADIASATLYAVPAAKGGIYRIQGQIAVTQAATTSSTLGAVVLGFTDADSSQAQTVNATSTSTGNALTTFAQVDTLVNAKAGTNITSSTSGYASSGATPMQFALHLRVQYLG